jgi:hypothetical protein
MIGTPLEIGFYLKSQTPDIDERMFNDGVPYADQAEVLSTLDEISRAVYQTVNIAGVEYWFYPDIYTLTVKNAASSPNAVDIPITDTSDIYDADNVEDALQEVMGELLALEIVVAAIFIPEQNYFTINLPAAANLAAKITAATEGTDYPNGWVLTATDTVNLTITHGLIKEIDHVTVKKVVGAVKTILKPYSTAYSEVTATTTSILVIEGIDPTATQTLIHLTFLP